MAANLTLEIGHFCKQTKDLRTILRDTQKCFNDINFAGSFNGTQLVTAEISTSEEEEVLLLTQHPPALVILGQTNHAKAFIVNEIFNQEILPLSEPPDTDTQILWRAVRFKYGSCQQVSLTLPGSFELVDHLESHTKSWSTIPKQDLQLSPVKGGSNDASPTSDSAKGNAMLEVQLDHGLLKEGATVVVSQSISAGTPIKEALTQCQENALPVIIYAIAQDFFSDQEVEDLKSLKVAQPDIVMFFVKVLPHPDSRNSSLSMNESPLKVLRTTLERHVMSEDQSSRKDSAFNRIFGATSVQLFQQLLELGYVSLLPGATSEGHTPNLDSSGEYAYAFESELVENYENFSLIVNFARKVLQGYLIKAITLLNVIHTRCLQTFITTAFEMARDVMVTPKRLEFAKEKESELYLSLMEIALKKQDEIRKIISETVQGMKADLMDKAEEYDFIGVDIPESGEVTSARDLKICTGQIQDLVLGGLNSAVAVRLLGSVDILKDSYTGVLTRCLESLEQSDIEKPESTRVSMALIDILNSAYQVEITVRTGASIIKVLLEKMRQLVHSMPWHTPPRIDTEWKRGVAANMLASLSETRLAKSICSQIKERLKQSHDTFSTALKQLEMRHSGRLEKTEEQRMRVRKVHAPRVARLVLESTSMKDCILYGMPPQGREIGRGQYGVVYSCEKWAGHSPCAIKSVVPPDDKHWNDLAMEFYYTKIVPQHERVVVLRGSVVDYSYDGGGGPSVLLIMDRLQRDLYVAIKNGLDWPSRLRVAIDVVEGIRFLHSQGLVHRDIKLKNVLLDKHNRAKLTDLGFCKPEAMMSGSIVGTPIHMAPELFTQKYDNSVDVYAFGILFWYVCAGHVKLPLSYEQCHNKEMLWTSVKRGARPERLPQFDDECWNLMQSCWHGDTGKRPLLGDVELQLINIHERVCKSFSSSSLSPSRTSGSRRNPQAPTAAAGMPIHNRNGNL